MNRPTPTQGAQSEAARVPLDELARQAKAAFEAMSPVDQAMHRLDQKRSGIHGSAPFDSPVSRAERDAVIDAWPEYVVLAAYRDERQASRDKGETIADLKRRLAEEGGAASDWCKEAYAAQKREKIANAHADALQARLTEAEQRAATAERRGFKAGRDAAVAMVRTVAANFLGPTSRMLAGLAKNIAALAPAVPQEGETTP